MQRKPISQQRVLVADDMPSMRGLVRAVLRHLGFTQIDEAFDGASAFTTIADRHPDLVICDWNMPRMSGLELLQVVRSTPEIATTPFLMVTAEHQRDQVTTMMELRVIGYVVKPFQPLTLQNQIRQWLNRPLERAVAAHRTPSVPG